MDIIPCDVVAAVTIGAAAKSSAAHDSPAAAEVPIYHACSAHCHPLTLGTVFECAAKFWGDNPPPLTLPATRCGGGQALGLAHKQLPDDLIGDVMSTV